MPDPLTVVLLGQPVGKGRPRFAGHGHAYTDKKTRANEGYLKLAAAGEMRDREMFTTPVKLTVRAEFKIQPSWSKKKKNAAILGQLAHGSSPDIDNIIKQIGDAFNGLVWTDDRLVSALIASKVYSNQPKLVITVSAL